MLVLLSPFSSLASSFHCGHVVPAVCGWWMVSEVIFAVVVDGVGGRSDDSECCVVWWIYRVFNASSRNRR